MQRVGPRFIDLHHYCAGLNYINRYQYRISDKNRGYYLGRAVPEIDYVAKNMPHDFPLAGEIYLNRGIALQLMHKDAMAIADFYRAIEHDPKQVAAYLAIADYHEKTRNKSKALEIVTTGLRHVPDNKRLQKRYLALGGKEPFPAPDATRSNSRESDPVDQSLPAPAATKETPALVSKPVHDTSVDAADGSAPQGLKGEQTKDTDGEAKPGIGSPTNPYCRFCP